MTIHPTFSVSTVFGKRDEVSLLHYSSLLLNNAAIDTWNFQPMLVACARQLIEQIR